MKGIDANTAKRLNDFEHLRQSIREILTTPIGSRVMRRDYGSRIFELIDAPMNSSTLLDIYAATVEALNKWEPRIRVKSVKATTAVSGRVVLDLRGDYLPNGEAITIEGIEVS